MEQILEKAREVGRLVSQSDEYRAFKRANERLSDDREAVGLINRLNEMQQTFARAMEQGEEPPQEEQEAFEQAAGGLQANAAYQAFEAARASFERLMMRVDEEIAKGMEAGEQSRIILSS